MFDGTRNTIRKNLASGSGDTGIRIIQRDSLIEHNVSTENGYGMQINSSGSIFRANLVSSNRQGLHFGESGSAELQGNVILEDDVGVYVGDSRGVVLERNLVARNRDGVVLASDSDHNLVSRNRIVDNSGFGLVLTPPLGGSPAHDNQVVRNVMLRNGVDGIFVGRRSEARGGANLLFGNVARSNGDDGIDVEDEATVLAHNFVFRNRDLGIEAVPGVTDGGGNRALHNGNPAQCLNVFCKTNGKAKK
jgi:parallel beta-helix repeat protein